MPLLASATFLSAVLVLAFAGGEAPTAVYVLSFWHYYLYALSYRYGEVEPAAFRRDALLMKSAALVALAVVYLASPLDRLSLAVVASGFALNAAGAFALGVERTYYGRELENIPSLRAAAFPYSVVSHPMLIGNVLAFGGTLLNEHFRRDWWPLAAIHVALNIGLLLMELLVEPQRRRVRRDSGEAPQAVGGASGCVGGLGVAVVAGILAHTCFTETSVALAMAFAVTLYAAGVFHVYKTRSGPRISEARVPG